MGAKETVEDKEFEEILRGRYPTHEAPWTEVVRLNSLLKLEVVTGIELSKSSLSTFTREELLRLLKFRFDSFSSFKTRELPNWSCLRCADDILYPTVQLFLDYIEREWDNVEAYSLSDLFSLKTDQQRLAAFRYLTPEKIFSNLPVVRIAVKGKKVKYEDGTERDNVYELWELESKHIDKRLRGKSYAVKCWCTTTNKAAWLWVLPEYADCPLRAIASTFWLSENVIEKTRCLKRQGDLIFAELDEPVIPKGPERPLTPEEYFGLLVAET
jgi:hypothetical protein